MALLSKPIVKSSGGILENGFRKVPPYGFQKRMYIGSLCKSTDYLKTAKSSYLKTSPFKNGQPIPALTILPVMMGIPACTPCLVHKELSFLDTPKNPGPDQLHPKLLKWLTTFLAKPLADLFNNSLAIAVVPGDWKAAVICPIFKKGDPEKRCQLPFSEPDIGCV